MPSMGNALRQDKYGWIPAVITSFNASSEDASKDINLNKVDLDSYTKSTASWAGGASAYGHSNMDALGAAPASTAGASTGGWADCFIDLDVAGSDIDSSWDGSSDFIPESGWLRCPTVTGATMTRNGGTTTTAIFAPYHSRIKFKNETSGHNFVRFFIAPNKLTGRYVLESPETWYDYLYDGGTNVQNRNAANIPTQATGLAPGGVIYIWSKSGVHEWNNEVDANRTHMCRPHFSGLVDAIDRTKPKGVAGWHGERYSYLNSLGITPAGGSKSYAAGLGAWFPKLGFSPYGGVHLVLLY